MIITREIFAEQVSDLDLHQGDTLRVITEQGPKLLIQIVRADLRPEKTKKVSAGAWARQYAGAARQAVAESTDDLRMTHYQEKYGV